jgi:tripartite-type tricarboxylate transporter receptor subunit TctC
MIALARFALLLLLFASALPQAAAQGYPQKPLRMVVPFAPGGTTDIVARLLSAKLAEPLGQPVVVENRPGANGIVGSEVVARAAPDGYTLLMGYLGNLAINPSIYAKLSYDPVRDYAPVTLVASTTQAIVVHPSLPAKTIPELIALARARPGQLNYASAGIGAPSHLSGELFKQMAGIDMVHVPYKGGGALMADLISGQVLISFGGLAAALPHVKSGKLRLLAVASGTRAAAVPDVPAVAETVPGFDVPSWLGVLAPAGTPREIVHRLHTEIAKVLAQPDIKERLAMEGGEAIAGDPEKFAAYLKSEIAKWERVVKDARIQAQ